MRTVTLNVPMCSQSALLLPEGQADGHRGLWFYDPNVYGDIEVGDEVVFDSGGKVLVTGVVVEITTAERGNKTFQDYCSRVNGKAFRWTDKV